MEGTGKDKCQHIFLFFWTITDEENKNAMDGAFLNTIND